MPVFYAEFVPKVRTRYGKPFNRYYRTEKPSYHAALYDVAPLAVWFNDTETNTWRLNRLTDAPFENITHYEKTTPRPPAYEGKYYEPLNDYAYMVIEGSRLLGIRENGYGAYVKNLDTGETCYACANGQFFLHEQIEDALRKLPYDPTASFQWHPVLFPCEGALINFADYVLSDPILSFPVRLNGHGSYDAQIEWIQRQEGLKE